MNKYEKYLDMIEFIDAVLSGSEYAINEYNRKKDIRDKAYFYVKFNEAINKEIGTRLMAADNEKDKLILIFAEQLKSILEVKKSNIEKKYSDSDIDFLKQFDGLDLTLEEACLVGKRDEYYNFFRLISYKMGKTSRKLDKEIDEEIQKLNGDYTPRLVWSFYNKHKKGKKN